MFFELNLSAQWRNFIQYTTEQGLPSNEIYDVIQLKNGKLLITSDRGISIYDGFEFKTLTTNHGLSSNTNFNIYKISESKYALIGYDGSLVYFYDNETLLKDEEISNFIKTNFPRNWISNIWFGEKSYYFTPSSFNLLFEYDLKTKTINKINKNGHLLVQNSLEKGIINLSKNNITPIKDNGLFKFYINKDILYFYKNQFEKDSLILGENILYKQFTFDPKNKHFLYFASIKNGLNYINLESKSIQQLNKTPDLSSIMIDREDNIWLTSIGRGLFKASIYPIFNIIKSENEFGMFQNLLVDSNFIYSFNSNGYLYKLEQEKIIDKKVLLEAKIYNLNLNKFGKNIYGLKIIEPNLNIKKFSENIIQSVVLDENLIFTNTTSLFYIDKKMISKPILSKIKNWGKIISLGGYKNKLFIGTLTGFFTGELKDDSIVNVEKYYENNKELKLRINCIRAFNQGFLAGTFEQGLLFIDKNKKLFRIKVGNQNLIIHNIEVLNNQVFLATTNGLYIIKLNLSNLKVEKFKKLTVNDGLSSNFINDIKIHNSILYIVTNNGMDKINLLNILEFEGETKRKVNIISINDNYLDSQFISLEAGTQNVKIYFNAIYFNKNKTLPFFKYALVKLGDKDTFWTESNDQKILFSNLLPKNYVFLVKCRTNNDLWSSSTILEFKILPKWYQFLWLRIIFIILSVALMILFIKLYINSIKKKAEIKINNEKLELSSKENELRALRNQMNPHFIFNSLNSIQKYIITKQFSEVNEYISKFATLMRTSLKMSKYEFTNLNKEIEFLTNYLEIEQLRFPDKFSFEFIVQNDINTDATMLPSLILQPLLENSIKHGFKNIKRKGEIKVVFSKIDQFWLKIEVSDNGTGIIEKNSSNLENNDNESFGLSIVKQRIDLLKRKTNDSKISFQILDNNPGVKIEITVPL